MPGLKQTQFNDNPVAFWTFDLDRNGFEGAQIIDEIDNLNPMTINSDTSGVLNYRLEQGSLNDMEPSDQHSISICPNQKVDGVWLNQFFEVPNSSAFDFPLLGRFSVEFLYNKASPSQIRNVGEPGYLNNVVSPILKKGNVFSCSIIDSYGGNNSSDYINIVVLGRTININNAEYPIYNRTNHVVMVYDVIQTDVNEYTSTMKVYLNGRLRGSNEQTHVDTVPVTATPSSWLIAGTSGTNPRVDFQTEYLGLDNMAIYGHALTDEQVGNHYRKTKHYATMITDDYPQRYWRIDEINDPLDSTLYSTIGGINGKYYGAVDNYHPGPPNLIESHATYFQAESSAVVTSYNQFNTAQPIISVNQDYTLEFWFKTNDGNQGMLFDCTSETPEFNGVRVWLNTKNNAYSPGNIQVSETINNHISSVDTDPNTGERLNYNDDKWHLIHIRREGNALELWIDGFMNSSQDFAKVSNGQPSQIHLMNAKPGNLGIQGEMCELAFYTYALQGRQIWNRWSFTTRYRMSGFALLQGAPVQARIRFYDSISGEKVSEVMSDGVTGEYIYYPTTKRYLDVLSSIPFNNTTRYRVHGPVLPAEYTDSHFM